MDFRHPRGKAVSSSIGSLSNFFAFVIKNFLKEQ